MAVPAWVSTTGHGDPNPTTACTITLGTTAADDILIVQVINGGANAAPTGPAGTYVTTGGRSWTDTVTGGLIDSGGWTSGWGGCWWSRCNANHSGQTITFTGATDSISAQVTRVSGVITGDSVLPYDTNIASATVAAGANCALASFDTVRPDDLVLYLVSVADNLTSSSPTMDGVAMGKPDAEGERWWR